MLVIASFFRFMGGYTIGLQSATFFMHRYPDHTAQFAMMTPVVVICGGLPSSFIGGYLSDKYDILIPTIKGRIAGYGALAACPFILITFVVQPTFWVSIWSLFIAYLFAEMWYGPAHAQINNLFPSEVQGFAVAIFNIAGLISGTLVSIVVSKLIQTYDPNDS